MRHQLDEFAVTDDRVQGVEYLLADIFVAGSQQLGNQLAKTGSDDARYKIHAGDRSNGVSVNL